MPLGSRPPPLPKGVPHPYNSIPRPPGPVPKGRVWAQGKWRNRDSKAARYLQKVNSRQVQRALEEPDLGEKIYAYCHIRTNQVVYSLTRSMDNSKVLPQLLYHGKKTRPAALRRDLWMPYFSLHFSSSRLGRHAFAQLRELSVLHQILPEESRITNTDEFSDFMFKRKGIGYDLNDETKPPRQGQMMPKKWRARVLMDQRATSVADVAFVIGLQKDAPGKEEQERIAIEKRVANFEELGTRAQTRALARIAELKKRAREIEKLRRDFFRRALHGGVRLRKNNLPDVAYARQQYTAELDYLVENYMVTRSALIAAATGEPISSESARDLDALADAYLRTLRPDDEAASVISTDTIQICEHRIRNEPTYRRQVIDRLLQLRRSSLLEHLKAIAPSPDYHYDFTPFRANESLVVSYVPSSLATEHTPILLRPALADGVVKVLWSDMQDARWVQSWPESTVHGQLTSGKFWSRNAHLFGEEKGELKKLESLEQEKKEAVDEMVTEDDGKGEGGNVAESKSGGEGQEDKSKSWLEKARERRARDWAGSGWWERAKDWLPGTPKRKSVNVV